MKAYSSSCQAVRKRRQRKNNLNQLMNKTLTLQGAQSQPEDSKGVACPGGAGIVQSRNKDTFATLQRGLEGMTASARAVSFQSLTLCGSAHTVWSTAWWEFPQLKQCIHVRCTAHLVQAPENPSEQKTDSLQQHLCLPWQLRPWGGRSSYCFGPQGKWCSLSSLAAVHPAHFSMEGWDFFPPGDHSVMLSHTDGLSKPFVEIPQWKSAGNFTCASRN